MRPLRCLSRPGGDRRRGRPEARDGTRRHDAGDRRRFGVAHIVGVLRRRPNENRAATGTTGLMSVVPVPRCSQKGWQGIIRQMVASGLLDIDGLGLWRHRRWHRQAQRSLVAKANFSYRADRIAKAPSRRRRSGTSEIETLDSAGNELLAVLKAKRLVWRKRAVCLLTLSSQTSRSPIWRRSGRRATIRGGLRGRRRQTPRRYLPGDDRRELAARLIHLIRQMCLATGHSL